MIKNLQSARRKNIPQTRVTSYATIDVNNKIGLQTEKQRQIILINVIENRYQPTFNEIKLGPFNTLVITYDDPLIQRLWNQGPLACESDVLTTTLSEPC